MSLSSPNSSLASNPYERLAGSFVSSFVDSRVVAGASVSVNIAGINQPDINQPGINQEVYKG